MNFQQRGRTAAGPWQRSSQVPGGGRFSGFDGDFCHSFQHISLYWLCFNPGFSDFSSTIMESENAANAAFNRLANACHSL